MNSTLAMTLKGFGTVLLSFGFVVTVLALLGMHYGTRQAMGGAGLIGLAFLIVGGAVAGGGHAIARSSRGPDSSAR